MKNLGLSLTLCIVAGALGACSSSSDKNTNGGDKDAGQKSSVRVASWWQAPGEAQAIAALISTFEAANPDYQVKFDLIKDGDTARAELAAQLASPTTDPPPDVAQYNANNVPTVLATYPDSLTTLDTSFTAASLTTANVPQEILNAVTVNSHIYSIPLNIHRENMLFYNIPKLTGAGLSAPTTIDDVIAACPTLKASGMKGPVLTSYQGWIQRIMFNSIAAGTMGASKFHDFMTGKIAFTDAAWSAAIDKYTALLDACVDDTKAKDTANYGWSNCADDLSKGNGAYFFHGDWAKGYLVAVGSTPGTDFGGVGSPGARDLFWFGVDVLILPKQSANAIGAGLFFDAATSIDGQVAFNKLKGSTPFRTDVPATALDPVGAQTQADFKDPAAIRMLVNAPGPWDTALGNYAVNRDKAALLKAYTDNPVTP